MAMLAMTSYATHAATNFSLTLTATITDAARLPYAVESRTYPESPDLLLVTNRQGGLSAWNTSDPAHPTPQLYWPGSNGSTMGNGIEGQDRMGDLLVVAELGDRPRSALITINATTFAPLGRAELSVDGALHCKLYRAASSRTYAIITSGLTHNTSSRNHVTAVDVTDPWSPVEVASLALWGGAGCAEGVYVVDDVAFIASYCSAHVATVNLTALPSALTIAWQGQGAGYENMVSAMYNSSYGGSAQRLLFSASYAAPGGLVVFDADVLGAQGALREVGRLITHNTSRANRMHVRADLRLAFLPLEKSDDGAERGGLAVVDLAEPAAPRLLLNMSIPNATSRSYCLSTKGRSAPESRAERWHRNAYSVTQVLSSA